MRVTCEGDFATVTCEGDLATVTCEGDLAAVTCEGDFATVTCQGVFATVTLAYRERAEVRRLMHPIYYRLVHRVGEHRQQYGLQVSWTGRNKL